MALEIEKRTRVSASVDWSDWATTTDAPPYTDTDIVEYRTVTDYNIDIADVTRNVQVDSQNEVIGDGIFDDLMETITRHVDTQYRDQRITGENYATVYLGLTQAALTQAIDFAKTSKLLEIQMMNAAKEGENLDAKRRMIEEQIKTEKLTNKTDGLMENQIAKMKADAEVSRTKADTSTAEALANIGKVLGYNYSVDGLTGKITIGTETGTGKLDYEIAKMQADSAVAKSKAEMEEINTFVTTRKVYGYTLDNDGNVVPLVDGNGDPVLGKIDYEIENIQKEVPLKLLSTQLGAWSSVFNSGKVDNVPTVVGSPAIETALADAKGV